ncbi:MAG TPA: MerR family transcriptional regulator [Caulobacteraceae bacterium]|jgi:DNA-binding transcriptional MerR regulator
MRDLEQRSGVGRETIRYYIRMGLVPEPERPKANVADYGEEHVRRLQTIKRLQAQHYLPLSFIKTLLDRPTHGEAEAIPGFDSLLLGRLGVATSGPGADMADAVKQTGLPKDELEILAEDGVINPFGEGAARRLGALDLAIAGAWGRARAAGYTPEAGFFPQDVKIYADSLRALAAVEIDRFFTRVPGGRSVEAAAELGRDGVEIINDLIGLLRLKFLLSAIRALPGAGEPAD